MSKELGMKNAMTIACVVGVLSCFGSAKVDSLVEYMMANEGKDLSEEQQKKVFEEVAKRQKALTKDEQKEFAQKIMAKAKEQLDRESSVKNDKVDALVAYVQTNDKKEMSEAEREKVWNEVEARENALSKKEKELFKTKMMAIASKQADEAMKKLLEIRVDTPAADMDWFADDTNSTESVFGVAFGTKVDKKVVSPSCDAGPLTPFINETQLKIPKPVKWFTMVSGQPNERNKRIESLTFKAAIPDTVPQSEVDRGVKQLEQLMMAKFGKDCLKSDYTKRDFRVVISDSEKMTDPHTMDPQAAVLSVLGKAKMPRSVTLYIENHRIAKLDPEIPQPEGGDGFADDLKIPAGVKLAEPETNGQQKPEQEYEDDAVFAKGLASPGNSKAMTNKSSELYRKLFKTKKSLVVAYLTKHPQWKMESRRGRENFCRTYWADGQYCKIELPTSRPFRDNYLAKEGCRNPEAGWYAGGAALYDEFSKVDALKDESEMDTIIPTPKRYATPVKPDIRLINDSQGGIYCYEAVVDPGEPGDVYLRAYELTKGTRLSADRMKQATRESVAGDKPQKVGKRFTIYEGDWEKYYAARIEIWFLPANGGKPRKLKEQLFRVQGWMF